MEKTTEKKKSSENQSTDKKKTDTTNAAMNGQEAEAGQTSILETIATQLGCEANKKTIAGNSKLMGRVMSELSGQTLNEALDFLYDEVIDVDILMNMIESRFGVPVVDNRKSTWKKLDSATYQFVSNTKDHGQPIAWSSAALREVYKVYILLPQGDLDQIKCLMHLDDTEYGGAAWGNKNTTIGVYYVNYKKGKETKKETIFAPSHTDNFFDRRNNTIMLDMTTAHELGHVVDGAAGWKYSRKGSAMRDVSKWKETANDPSTVVSAMEKSINGTIYGGKLSDNELELARKVGVRYLKRDQDSFAGKWSTAAATMISDLKAEIKSSKAKVSDADKLGKSITSKNGSSLLYHLWRGQAANSSWYNHSDAMKGMKRPYHQGYKDQEWYTFDKSCWNDKISCYQFRNPKEEFAETYASYHAAPTMGKKKGENTPKGLLDWFISEGLGDAIPEGGNAGVEESSERK